MSATVISGGWGQMSGDGHRLPLDSRIASPLSDNSSSGRGRLPPGLGFAVRLVWREIPTA